ncbi:unnamed protein product [Ceutorhynchus assimilis]|uniref:Caveolin n=1 Tax=Ceutorhynchus assimilis TaxID=467358 RepID=A0A9N9QN71_9CUCU|nr:unnamed protein product [Ceutorhynchus assimilis]
MAKSSEDYELEDRDPKKLNRQLEVNWEDIVGEPASLRSPECAWTLGKLCFRFSRITIYTCLSIFCAPFVACCIGTTYACYQFEHIWCNIPCLRLYRISCGVTKSFVLAFTHGLLIPLMEAFGHLCSKIKVRTMKEQGVENTEEEEKILIV